MFHTEQSDGFGVSQIDSQKSQLYRIWIHANKCVIYDQV